MKVCTKCLINQYYPNIKFDSDGICSLCSNKKPYNPLGEDKLLKILKNNKNQKSKYDVLVPLSGGKDSAYILHLAVNIYKLKVLTMTYDNGFFSQLALDNIKRSIKNTKVEHIWFKPDPKVQQKIYRNMLLSSGDLCGACDIGTNASVLKVAEKYSIPIILYGTSPLEESSFVPDTIQDIKRFKYILKQHKNLTKKEINDYLIYPKLNHFKLTYYKKTNKFAKTVMPLFYIDNPSDREIGEIISKSLGWQDDGREYSKHLDCIAEPLTNYIRNKIYKYERRLCQFSNMIRNNEISRDHAVELYKEDNIESLPKNYLDVLDYLDLSSKDLERIISIKPLKYEKHTSKLNRLYLFLVRIINHIQN